MGNLLERGEIMKNSQGRIKRTTLMNNLRSPRTKGSEKTSYLLKRDTVEASEDEGWIHRTALTRMKWWFNSTNFRGWNKLENNSVILYLIKLQMSKQLFQIKQWLETSCKSSSKLKTSNLVLYLFISLWWKVKNRKSLTLIIIQDRVSSSQYRSTMKVK